MGFTIPEDFGLVIIVVVLSFAVIHLFMGFSVVKARKKYAPARADQLCSHAVLRPRT